MDMDMEYGYGYGYGSKDILIWPLPLSTKQQGSKRGYKQGSKPRSVPLSATSCRVFWLLAQPLAAMEVEVGVWLL
jgi:hypothetical protein